MEKDYLDRIIIPLSVSEIFLIRRAIWRYIDTMETRNLDIHLNGEEDRLSFIVEENNIELSKLRFLRDILDKYLIYRND